MNDQDIFRRYLQEEGQGGEAHPSISAIESLRAVRARIDTPARERKNIYLWRYTSIVAAIAVVVFGIKYIPTKTPISQSKTYSTVSAQRANITLADGSTVILAPATRITVTGRNVDLQGEAVFTVTQHSGAPFTVMTGNTTTRVLGTTFGIRKYSEDKEVRVIVAEGKVSVGNNVLSIGDIARVDSHGNITQDHNADIASVMGWTQGILVFRDTPARDVLAELERWYGIQFRTEVPAATLSRQVNGTLESAPQAALIPLISDLLGVRAEQRGSVVILKER